MFLRFQATSKFPSSRSLKIKAILVEGGSPSLQLYFNQSAAEEKTMTGGGGLLETTGRPTIVFANRAEDPKLTRPCPQQASTSLIPQLYILYLYKRFDSSTIFVSGDFFFPWSKWLKNNCVSLMFWNHKIWWSAVPHPSPTPFKKSFYDGIL